MTAPVLIVGYRRPDLVARVLARVAGAGPARLFLACDGPRIDRPGEIDLVMETRQAMDGGVTWECDVQRLYSASNQGCRAGVRAAIDWFFSHVEEGIILEDDCIPHPEFFPYCTELLERYRMNERVMHISGDGSVRYPGSSRSASYVFSREALVWGWATWRRAWRNYDAPLDRWAAIRSEPKMVSRVFPYRPAAQHWAPILNRLRDLGEPDTWDYQWSFSVLERSGLAIIPRTNLISNAGHRSDAMHTFRPDSPRANVRSESILPLVHPRRVAVRGRSDQRFQSALRGFGHGRLMPRWLLRLVGRAWAALLRILRLRNRQSRHLQIP